MNKPKLAKMMDIADVTSAKRIFARDYVSAGVPFYRGKEITELHRGALEVSTDLFITAEKYAEIKIKHGAPEEGDILLTSVGTLGSVYLVKSGDRFYFKDGNVTWFRKLAGVTGAYLRYWLISPEGRAQLQKCMIGSSQSAYTIENLKRMEIPLPSVETQHRIASILGAYDDLIAVNRRRIAVLEEMARGLFTEWFIHLRFPGHAGVTIEDTADGPLPAGWAWGTVSDLVLFDPRTRVPRDGEKPFIPMGHLDTATSLIAEPEARTGNSGAKFQNGDTLFARITPCLENGKTGLVRNLPGPDGVGFGSTEFIVMRGGRVGPAFSYCLSRLPAFREHARMSMSGATGRQRARTDSVADFSIAIPPTNNLFERFEKAAWPMLELVGQIGLSNARLAAARDLLLPRLISGQLSVAQAERELEAA
ncbi:restriction endonuclease subunit S [Paraburkholderia hospita]|uniref:restriction endonuclease subunit S n=1 Tax=Paraburkholderia hospita TaxID=169430 RepID=UPI000DEFF1B5|nr:restriction endonuclease subunit S [Paraburkholderia hospita]AXE97335.1 restriction endonuclease subunit S [Paraburkholderia hospita]